MKMKIGINGKTFKHIQAWEKSQCIQILGFEKVGNQTTAEIEVNNL